ncbi:NAD(P)H-dependent oxidoreductase [Dokdonia sp. R86516]|uniref:glutathione-regulated potassium-efflux system oxidoreductase KefF n=1 Tax=Dokdonia sp. R86516 TaxID=3093856 RepID=UPI0037C579A9
MKKILVLFSHPKFEKSRANTSLVSHIQDMESVTFHDLYEQYPDFHIDVDAEKELLAAHDIIVWHHPLYWYSCPPLMKQWIDMVLEFGWAYGPNGNALKGKTCLNVITTGGSKEVYCAQGSNSFTINEFLRPFEQTAILCGMQYYPPFAVMGTHQLNDDQLDTHSRTYKSLLELLQKEAAVLGVDNCIFLNDLPELKTH